LRINVRTLDVLQHRRCHRRIKALRGYQSVTILIREDRIRLLNTVRGSEDDTQNAVDVGEDLVGCLRGPGGCTGGTVRRSQCRDTGGIKQASHSKLGTAQKRDVVHEQFVFPPGSIRPVALQPNAVGLRVGELLKIVPIADTSHEHAAVAAVELEVDEWNVITIRRDFTGLADIIAHREEVDGRGPVRRRIIDRHQFPVLEIRIFAGIDAGLDIVLGRSKEVQRQCGRIGGEHACSPLLGDAKAQTGELVGTARDTGPFGIFDELVGA
jgi:hypothetical protein